MPPASVPNSLTRSGRYMPFAKFISLISYQALWFSKLNILQDTYEGMLPAESKRAMREEDEEFKSWFDSPEHHRQIDAWADDNENDGRELLVVNCWFLGERPSERMWSEYGGSNDAVAIKSTVGRLANNVFVPRDEHRSHIGLVSYVDYSSHRMGSYEAQQAIERAFLKDKERFSHEQEVRIVTMSTKTTSCVSMEGKKYTLEEVSGKNMNNFENPGLYVCVRLDRLITEVVVPPTAKDWFEKLVRCIVERSNLSAPVTRSYRLRVSREF
jgi:hypothetical protein